MSGHHWLPQPVAEMAAWDPDDVASEREPCRCCGRPVADVGDEFCGACEREYPIPGGYPSDQER